MSITIELPPDLDERVRVIPDLDKRIVQFLRTQTDLEEWRNRHYSPEARAVSGRALAESERLRAEGITQSRHSSSCAPRTTNFQAPVSGGDSRGSRHECDLRRASFAQSGEPRR